MGKTVNFHGQPHSETKLSNRRRKHSDTIAERLAAREKNMVEGILLLAQAQIIIFVGENLSFEGANNDNNVSFALLSCDAICNLNF